jgi:amidase
VRILRAASILVLLALAMGASVPAAGDEPGDGLDLDAATIPYLQRLMDSGKLSSVRLTMAYLARIRALDEQIHAVLAVDPTAEAQAAASDRRRANGQTRGPLDGIPVLVKDNIDTKGLVTTVGSRALLTPPPAQDATAVHKLRAAGAVILGKANLSEWANFRSSNATSGWSAAGGQTNNPYLLDHNPCGSSSGSGAGIAASLAQVALGTETDGSIVCPAGANGIVGHKPSLGLVGRTGVAPISAEQDTVGPMSRHVVDTAITLSVLQGRDDGDPATAQRPADRSADYAAQLAPEALRGARIGVYRQAGLDPDVDRVVEESVAKLRERGATVVDVDLPYREEVASAELPALITEFARDLPAYLARRAHDTDEKIPQTIAELVEFNRQDPVELSRFGQEFFERALTAPDTDDPAYLEQRATATSLARRSIDETMAAHDLDAIMSPTNGPAWETTYGSGDEGFLLESSGLAAVAGYPNISVPGGYAGELPIGVSLFAGRWQDAKLLSLAAGLEAANPIRHAPRFLPG